MTDPLQTDPPDTAAADEPAPPAAPQRERRSGNGLLWLLVLALLAAVAWLAWQEWLRMDGVQRADDQRGALAALDERVTGLEQGNAQIEALRRGQRALEQRLADAASTNALLREEVLAVAERAALLEDAIARQAEQRLHGALMMKLNETEFLLLMGAERLRLFGDPAATIEAYQLAEATLAAIDDPLAAGLRETLARELATLHDLPRDPVREARAALDAITAALPGLPPPRVGAATSETASGDPTAGNRLLGLVSGLVTVRRTASEDGAILDPLMREAMAAALALDLASARAAAERADTRAYHAALMRAEQRVQALYDGGSPQVADVRQQIAAAAALELNPSLPALGATLSQLRGLRATRDPTALPAVPEPVQ